ncbi:hypothetical protein [Roseateles sp. L2-2]|uniref:hypothetical protein n=1 Tax=Roseateles TaxID=93681 RepID=UPI003D36FBFD
MNDRSVHGELDGAAKHAMRRGSNYFLAIALVTFTFASLFGALWFLTPTNLGKTNTGMETVSARFQQPIRGRALGTALLLRSDGTSVQVPCSQVAALCGRLEQGSIEALSVWLAPPVLMETPWVMAAEHHGRDVLFEVDQRILLMAYRGRHATMAAICLAITASVLSLAVWLRRASKRSDA